MRFLLFPTLFLLCAASLSAQECAPGWAYYRTVQVTNASTENLNDHQVLVELNTAALVAAGKLRPDGADLRVYAGDCTPLPFWGDSLGRNTATRIWVKLPSLNAGAVAELQVYYGMSTAAAATDGDATFLFFDDFNSGTIDPAKWEAVGEFADFSVTDSLLAYASTSMNPGPRFKFARTVPTFSERVIFDYVGQITNANGFGFSSSTGTELERILFRQSGSFGFDTLNQVAFMPDTFTNGFATVNQYPLLEFPRFQFSTTSITVGVDDENMLRFTRFANVGLGTENTDEFIPEQLIAPSFHFIISSFSQQTIYLDNIRVRRHTDTPPTSTVGTEQANPNDVPHLIDPALVRVFPNPATAPVQVSIDYDEPVLLRVFDAQGRQLATLNQVIHSSSPLTLDTRQLATGTYLLQFARQSDGEVLHLRRLNKM